MASDGSNQQSLPTADGPPRYRVEAGIESGVEYYDEFGDRLKDPVIAPWLIVDSRKGGSSYEDAAIAWFEDFTEADIACQALNARWREVGFRKTAARPSSDGRSNGSGEGSGPGGQEVRPVELDKGS